MSILVFPGTARSFKCLGAVPSVVIFWGILFSVEALSEKNERRFTQGAMITRIDKSLSGYTFKTLDASSLLSCGQYCLKDSRCVSTNFKLPVEGKNHICSLNDGGILDGNNSLVPDKGVVFSQYARSQDFGNQDKNSERSKDYALDFPKPTDNRTTVVLRGRPNRTLMALTICFWTKSSSSRPVAGTLLSYRTDNVNGEIEIFNPKNFRIKIGGQATGQTGISAADGNWHHICFTWEAGTGSWNCYKDGNLKSFGKPLGKGHVIKAGGCFVLGQNQEEVCGAFRKGFAGGVLTNLNIWDYPLSQKSISALSESCLLGIGNVIQWLDFKQGLRGKVKKVTPSTCQP